MRSIRLVPRGEHRDMRRPEKLRFEAHVSVEVDVVEPEARRDVVIGLDRGIVDTCALSTGEHWSPPEPSAKEAKRLAKTKAAVQTLARQGKQGTRAWKKAVRALRKIRKTIRNRAIETTREYVRSLAERYHTVVVEDLRLPAMTASARGRGLGVAAKTGLNRGLQDARLETMLRLLVTAVENRGGRVLALPAAYSSQTCAQCGHVDAKSRKGKAFHCTCCGHVDDADVNAGHIMAGRGRVYLGTLAQGYTDQEALSLLWACIKGARDTSSVEPSAESKGDGKTEGREAAEQARASAEDGYAAWGRQLPRSRCEDAQRDVRRAQAPTKRERAKSGGSVDVIRHAQAGPMDLRDWDSPGVAEHAMKAIRAEMRRMEHEPGSSIKMCHEQGKTAVYLSDDGSHIVHHAPDGTITRTPHATRPTT